MYNEFLSDAQLGNPSMLTCPLLEGSARRQDEFRKFACQVATTKHVQLKWNYDKHVVAAPNEKLGN